MCNWFNSGSDTLKPHDRPFPVCRDVTRARPQTAVSALQSGSSSFLAFFPLKYQTADVAGRNGHGILGVRPQGTRSPGRR
jgi:hypothetical protein